MKRIIIIIVVTVLFIAAGVGAWFADMHREARLNNENSTEYIKPMQVCEVDRANNIVVLVDNGGDAWEFEGVEDWEVDDLVCVRMSDNNTTTIYDDIILEVWA